MWTCSKKDGSKSCKTHHNGRLRNVIEDSHAKMEETEQKSRNNQRQKRRWMSTWMFLRRRTLAACGRNEGFPAGSLIDASAPPWNTDQGDGDEFGSLGEAVGSGGRQVHKRKMESTAEMRRADLGEGPCREDKNDGGKTRFRSVNNCKELQEIHMQVKSEHVGTLKTTELMTQSRTTSTTTCLTWTKT